MKELIDKLNYYTKLYDEGKPEISDKEWDDLYFKLKQMEEKTGVILPDSPTQHISFRVVSELKKVQHGHPMLSLNKTKNIEEVESFLKGHNWIVMAKMDGLTCSLRYLNGRLYSAETRGDGIEGEDITHNAMVISSIPKEIPYMGELIVDGEIICKYEDFEDFKDKYKNPRNFASGSIRLLNSKECYNRHLTFVAWDVIKGGKYKYLSNNLSNLRAYGFEVVPMFINGDGTDLTPIEEYINSVRKMSKEFSYPIDGVVFKYDTIKEYDEAGHTDHHFKGGLAYKFYDETYSTRLHYITWTMGRTGVLTPVANFDPVEIDGTEVSRASLHNVSIMHETLGDCAYVGEPLKIYKANQIIPQIYSAGPKYNYGEVIAAGGVSANDVIENCPICGHPVSYKKENGIIRVYCDNSTCNGKLINQLDHFCGKKGLDIKGLSKKTLEKLIDWEWINSISDIFTLKEHEKDWIEKPGFGPTSVSNILKAIEKSKKCPSDKFLCAIGIPLIGKTASAAIMKVFYGYNKFRNAIEFKNDKLYNIPGVGEIMLEEIFNFNYDEFDSIFDNFIDEIKYTVEDSSDNQILKDKVFCVTGKLKTYKNRNELKETIEKMGGKVTGSVTSKTVALINNDINSTSSKNQTAKKLNVPIITEDEFRTQYLSI